MAALRIYAWLYERAWCELRRDLALDGALSLFCTRHEYECPLKTRKFDLHIFSTENNVVGASTREDPILSYNVVLVLEYRMAAQST